ncbi:uncharacterized protein V6R79_010587 [Siganus canaliculatus]
MKSVIYFHHKNVIRDDICRSEVSVILRSNVDEQRGDIATQHVCLCSFCLPPQFNQHHRKCHERRSPTLERGESSKASRFSIPARLSHYTAAMLLEDTEGQKRLNSSVVYSLETNQEKPQNNNPCLLS